MIDMVVREYRRRRAERLAARGVKPKEFRKTKDSEKIVGVKKEMTPDVRMDAPDDEEKQQNNNRRGGGGESGGGHGNTRLPFGLCEKFGIEVGEDWTPRDAWDALAGKGVTPDKAYEKLKKGEDLGELADEEVKPKEPKTSFEEEGTTYTKLHPRYRSWDKDSPFTLRCETEDGGATYRYFLTKPDLMYYLKERGIEETIDPQTGEVVNPSTMELPKKLFTISKYSTIRGYTDATIGYRKGRYAVICTDLSGKKRTLEDTYSLADAKKYLESCGVEDKDIKLSPATRKREAERTAWMTSDKKEYIEEDGVKYGDLQIEERYGRYDVSGTSAEGKYEYLGGFGGKTSMMKYFKENGVERVKINGEYVNPQEYEFPKIIVTIDKTDFQEFSVDVTYSGTFRLKGVDIDGGKIDIDTSWVDDDYDKFLDDIKDKYGVSEDQLTLSDEQKEAIQKLDTRKKAIAEFRKTFDEKSVVLDGGRYVDVKVKYDETLGRYTVKGMDSSMHDSYIYNGDMATVEEYFRRSGLDVADYINDEETEKLYKDYLNFKNDFMSRAVVFGGGEYVDVHLAQYGDHFVIKGTDIHQRKVNLTDYEDMYEIDNVLERYNLSPDDVIKDESVRQAYDEYQKFKKEFETISREYGGKRYADISLSRDGGKYILKGKDIRGRTKTVDNFYSLEELEDKLRNAGIEFSDVPMDDRARELYDTDREVKKAVESGEYRKLGPRRMAYKNFRIEKNPDDSKWTIFGDDIHGDKREIFSKKYDDAIDMLEDEGITDYQVIVGDKIRKRPTDGMRRVVIRRSESGFKVTAQVGDAKNVEVYSSSSENEVRRWLDEHNVDSDTIKTVGMNPNDDVPRTHTAVSLANFDTYRMEREPDFPVLTDMTDAQKREVVDMLTDIFENGAYRMRRKDHFEDIFDTHFKNLLETGTSGGSTYKEGRRTTGEKTFGNPFDIEPSDAEKYGYVGLDNDGEAFRSSVADWYGKIMFKFKKDRVNDRVTYCAGDSLDSGRPLAGYAGPKPTYEGMSAVYRMDRVQAILDSYKEYKEGKISFSDFYNELNRHCRDGYMECHIHGEVTMDDVESIVFPKRTLEKEFDKMTLEKRRTVLTGLKNRGIIMQYEEHGELKDAYEYLERLYEPEWRKKDEH